MPYKNGNIVWNATHWSDEMIQFLKDNYLSKTNQQLADALNLRLTATRNKTRELGLKKFEPEYWSKSMVQFLKNSYKSLGDVEIMELFKRVHPKVKGWKRGAIRKKRKQMNLMRTAKQIDTIKKRHHKSGGRSFTIIKNSSSINMHPRWVAQQIAWRNPELQLELMKHPEIIEAGKNLILIKRMIKTNSEKAA